jgi:pimeloyl-ACP methyl ester carboxylesterase
MRSRRLVALVVVIGLIAFLGYAGYVGAVGSDEYVRQPGSSEACDTPGTRFGWNYEAINYDRADDDRLVADNPDLSHCATSGSPAGSEVVSSDGIPLAGWYIPGESIPPTGPTLVIVHGGRNTKSGVLKYAPPFHSAYNLVLLDLRNTGRSGDDLSTPGFLERQDVRAMIDWLERTKHPDWIGLVGNSNGAAASLAEAVDDDRIQALVLDSMHASVVAQLGNVLTTENGHPAWPGSWAIVLGVSLRVGGDITSVDPIRTITRIGTRPVLLIHGSADLIDRPADSLEPNVRAARDAGVDVEVHVCDGAGHGSVIDTCPADWATWATSFLEAAH